MRFISERRQRLEEGSGTMLGVMLIMLAAVSLSVGAAMGNLAIRQNEARNLADLAAFEGAYAWWQGWTQDPCAFAGTVAAANAGDVVECGTAGEDVRVTVEIATSVPVVPQVRNESLAGPVNCE